MWTSMSRIFKHYQGTKCNCPKKVTTKWSPVLPTNSVQPSRRARLQKVLIQLGKQLDCWTIGKLVLSKSISVQFMMSRGTIHWSTMSTHTGYPKKVRNRMLLEQHCTCSMASSKYPLLLVNWFFGHFLQRLSRINRIYRKNLPDL